MNRPIDLYQQQNLLLSTGASNQPPSLPNSDPPSSPTLKNHITNGRFSKFGIWIGAVLILIGALGLIQDLTGSPFRKLLLLRPASIHGSEGFAYSCSPKGLPQILQQGYRAWSVKENGRVLSHGGVGKNAVVTAGRGVFSLKLDRIVHFSTSDGSDARTNGRRYEIQLSYDVNSGVLLLIWLGLLTGASLLLLGLTGVSPLQYCRTNEGREAASLPPDSGCASSGGLPQPTQKQFARHAIFASLIFAVGSMLAFLQAKKSTEGIRSPYDVDHYRDIGSAQSIIDGDFPGDPAYRGELIWYNPLMPATVALVSAITGRPPEQAYVNAGPYLSAAGMITFFAMMLLLIGPWPAVFAAASLIFGSPYDVPPWATPTFSAWLFAANFSPVFFYIGLILCRVAAKRGTVAAWVAVGVILGVTFMAHTAPALILGICAVGMALLKTKDAEAALPKRISPLLAIAILVVVALVVSLPLTWSILGHYHMSNRNSAPNNWNWDVTLLANLGKLMHMSINSKNILAALGLVFVLSTMRRSCGQRLIFIWFAAALLLIVYGYLNQAMKFGWLPPLLPNYHAYVYIQAAGHALVGIAIWQGVSLSLRLLKKRVAGPHTERFSRWAPPAVVLVLVVTFVGIVWPLYATRMDATTVRQSGLQMTADRDLTNLVPLIRSNTEPGTVILATPIDANFHVVPANRHVVVLVREFSNPYVEFEARDTAQRDMLESFLTSDVARFEALAKEYHVTHVLLGGEDASRFDRLADRSIAVREIFRSQGYVLLHVTPHSRG